MSKNSFKYRQRCIRSIIKPKVPRELNVFEQPDGTLHASSHQIGTNSISKVFFDSIWVMRQVRFFRSAELNVAAERKLERGRDRWPPTRLESGLCLKTTVTI